MPDGKKGPGKLAQDGTSRQRSKGDISPVRCKAAIGAYAIFARKSP